MPLQPVAPQIAYGSWQKVRHAILPRSLGAAI